MLYHSRFHRKFSFLTAMLTVSAILFSVLAQPKPPDRLDLFDASDNNLMFVTFQYDAAGRNISREVFMSDSTFMRRVAINYNPAGQRISEVSYNFNEDTSFVLTYQPGADMTGFTIVDQFKLDHVGGAVNYSNADPLNFDLTYQKTGGVAARVAYEKDNEGHLIKVLVYGQSGAIEYYGLFTTPGVGVKRGVTSGKSSPQALVKTRGGSMIEVEFNLRSAGEVRCELVTLSGRHAATLLRGRMEQGVQKRRFRFDGGTLRGVAGGVYVVTVSVDGVTVSRSRYLHQNRVMGGVR
ncbi:MAG: hypothetical protein JW913_03890 [Chitinispirillaceae bacterium]|nr:hypothetical protein [Chitinispirillaceae bacterium]